MSRVETIVRAMATGVANPEMQLVQTGFRMALADNWDIRPGASVLEIGCGQGDMTAVLADIVGGQGQVTAVDIADPSYGAPVSLGAAAEFLLSTPLGARVDIRFDFDVLDDARDFGVDTFDNVVLSQCSWYFESVGQFQDILTKIRPWARSLCFSEWDLVPRDGDQLPHLLAVLIQGQFEAAGSRGDGNVRTPFSRETLLRALEATGWRVTSQHTVHDPAMHDADWEIGSCLHIASDEARLALLPDAVREFVGSQVDVLRAIARDRANAPLPAYTVTAERTSGQ
jgi:SAM-dependent methyltransferase